MRYQPQGSAERNQLWCNWGLHSIWSLQKGRFESGDTEQVFFSEKCAINNIEVWKKYALILIQVSKGSKIGVKLNLFQRVYYR